MPETVDCYWQKVIRRGLLHGSPESREMEGMNETGPETAIGKNRKIGDRQRPPRAKQAWDAEACRRFSRTQAGMPVPRGTDIVVSVPASSRQPRGSWSSFWRTICKGGQWSRSLVFAACRSHCLNRKGNFQPAFTERVPGVYWELATMPRRNSQIGGWLEIKLGILPGLITNGGGGSPATRKACRAL